MTEKFGGHVWATGTSTKHDEKLERSHGSGKIPVVPKECSHV